MAQNKSDLDLLYSFGEKKCKLEENSEFCKAFRFYQNKNFDSCYIITEKILLRKDFSKDDRDFLNYISGFSSLGKGLNRKALSNFNLISDSSNIRNLKYFQLGTIYLNLKKFKKSISSFLIWEVENKNFSNHLKKIGYHNLAVSYLHIKEFAVAKKYFSKEFELIDDKDTLGLIRTKMDLANTYYTQYMDDEAIPLFNEAYILAKSYKSLKWREMTTKNMAVVERNRKNFEKSLKYFDEYDKLRDSIWNRDNIVGLVEKDKQIAVAQKQQEITLQEEEIKRQNLVQNGLLAGASGLVIFIGFLGFLYRKLKKQNELITQQKEDLNTANKTKDYLFSVVSHDLRSPMNTIKSQHIDLKNYIETNDLEGIKKANDAAILVTESTSHLLNNVLHWSLEQSNQLVFDTNEYALRPLVQHVLHDYATLVEARGITVETELENVLAKFDKESVKIVLRNLLDNALKYMGGKGKIALRTGAISDNEAFISIEDTGQGISHEKLKKINALKDLTIDKIDRSKGVGLGLLLCQTLVKKNNGSITFESDEGKGTKITILLARVAE